MLSVLGFLLLLWVIFVCGLALCLEAVYWYETRNSPDGRIPAPDLGFLSALKVFGTSLLGVVLVQLTGLFRCRAQKKPGPISAGKQDDVQPVVLIHGLFSNSGAWLALAPALAEAGYAYSTYNYKCNNTSVDDIIDGLEGHMAAVERYSGGKKPILIGHSMGGLVARRWLAHANNESRVAGLVTLATPHMGSKLAVVGKGRITASLRPQGSLTVSLRGAKKLNIPCVGLVSPVDVMVLPAASLVPPDDWKMRITPPCGHYPMIFSKKVIAMVLEEIKGMGKSGKE
ncbi:alpha/beta fold hydrolase [Desulfovibrio sp. OttesenSCG-928-G15]|nr:alpha/beta fold hydrolase [Desulfovibrio sp. OttesenSCG-928-G15]